MQIHLRRTSEHCVDNCVAHGRSPRCFVVFCTKSYQVVVCKSVPGHVLQGAQQQQQLRGGGFNSSSSSLSEHSVMFSSSSVEILAFLMQIVSGDCNWILGIDHARSSQQQQGDRWQLVVLVIVKCSHWLGGAILRGICCCCCFRELSNSIWHRMD